ncbi:MAG: DUF5979 domain-containing protein [Pseudolysinimonas sp.]
MSVGLENPNTVITGGFTITKVVSGAAAPSVPTAFTFPVTYSYVDLAGVTQSTTVNLTKSGATQTATVPNVPVGTVVTLSEGARGAAAPDVAWGTPIWSSNVTTNLDGTASFTVGTTGVSVVLDNPTTRVVTSLSLTKSVTGPAASSVPGALTYTVNYDYTDFAGLHSFSTTVSKDSPTITLPNIPLGVTVNLAEVAPSGAPPSVSWSTAKWTSTGATITDNGDGSASITVSTASAITIGLENPTTLLLGGFTVTKSVTGDAAASVPGAFAFTLTYTYPGQATSQTLTVSKNSPTATVTGLPVGTVVTIAETTPTGAPADVSWSTPIWSGNATTNPDGSATFTVGATPLAVTIENPTVRRFASLDLTKTVTGSAAASVPGNFDFTVTYSYTDVAGLHTQTATVSKNSPTVALADIPVGSVVTFTEAARTGAPAVVGWQTPAWTASGATMVDNGDGSGTLTISGTGSISVGLENPTTTVTGGFTFSKSVSGPGAASVPNGFDFTVTYTYPGQATPQTLTVTKASPNASVTGLPVGTVVTIAENTPGTAAADVAWGTPTWSSNVTTNPDGSATFTIDTTPVAVALDNPTTRLFGSIELTKSVTGAAAAAVPGAYDFTIDYSYTDAAGPQTGSVTVSKNSPTVTISTIPLGSVVTLSEVAPTGAPAVVAWLTPVWTATGGTITDNGDGTASLTVSDTASVAIGLENPTTQVLSGFSIQKSVSGAVVGSVPGSFDFTLTYTYPGQASPQTLTVSKNSPTATVSGLPVGTVVTVSEATPASPAPNVGWGTPTWSANTTTNPDRSATFTVGTTSLAVLLDNPTVERFGSFSITKSVTGPSAADVDPTRVFTGTYSYPGQTSSGAFTIQAGQTWTLPATETIPAGTVVTISEILPTGGLPTYKGWGTPILSVGGTPFGTGATGDITIGANTVVSVGLENPTTIAPHVSILKGDGTGTTIVHDADTMPDAEYYAPGETRTIVVRVTNDGPEPLRNVTLTDTTLSGASVQGIVWTLPDGSTVPGSYASGVWSADWTDTFGTGTAAWAPGEVITGSAQLTVDASDAVHVDRAQVDAVGQLSGTPVTARNNYNAYTASIQIIHYDGNRPDPVVKDALGNWVTPTNPLVDAAQDANDTTNAVKYPEGAPQQVRWVITNVGTTYLTHLTMNQMSTQGPQYSSFTFDMTPIGGSQTAYNFATQGPWNGIFPPGASFFGTGPLTLDALDFHEDTTQVVGSVVIPETDGNGLPTNLPTLALGRGVFFTLADGSPRIVQDSDPFNARAVPAGLAFTGVHQDAIAMAVWIAVGGVLLGLALMVVPTRRRQRTRGAVAGRRASRA